MSPKEKKKSKKKNAWKRFSARVAKRMEKHQSEFQEMQRKYEQETDPERKQKLKISYLEKFAPTFMISIFEELNSTSEKNFDEMMSEIYVAMEKTLEQLGRDYLDFEMKMREPIEVLEEIFITKRVWRAVERELKKHEELFENTDLLLRFMELMTIRQFAFGVAFATLRPFFEVFNIARDRLGIDENWATAVFALNLEETLVKKKLSELGVSKNEMKGRFYKLIEKAIDLIETKEHRQLPTEVDLSVGYRRLRNKLFHEGHLWKPTRKETNDIVRHLFGLVNALWVK